VLAGTAQAGLIPYTAIGGVQVVYDPDRDLTWVADASLFKTQYDADNTLVDKIIMDVVSVTDSLVHLSRNTRTPCAQAIRGLA